jgi:hypothetical protein
MQSYKKNLKFANFWLKKFIFFSGGSFWGNKKGKSGCLFTGKIECYIYNTMYYIVYVNNMKFCGFILWLSYGYVVVIIWDGLQTVFTQG